MEKEKIELWAFYYCPMTEESASYIESYHRTKKGATEAMKKHKKEIIDQFNEDYKGRRKPFTAGRFESWEVKKFTLIIED